MDLYSRLRFDLYRNSGPRNVVSVSFIGKKAAMKFDVEKMFEETRRSAREYTQNVAS